MLKRITTSPYLNLFSGLVLLGSSGYEVMSTWSEGSAGLEHGVFVYSLVHIIQTIPDLMHGLTEIEESREYKISK